MLPLHPKLVHLPVALALLMPLLTAALLWAWRSRRVSQRGWMVAAALQCLLVGSAIVALRAGQQDEERIERAVPESAIEAHEEAAEGFVWTAAAVLAVFLASAVLRRQGPAQALGALAWVGTVAVLGLGIRAGEAGGRLVYQYGAAAVYATGGGAAPGGAAATVDGHSSARDDRSEDDD